jgi:AcrR family transcriptional regulator
MSPRHNAADAERTRATIVEGAVKRASVDGFDGLTIGQLASELGLSKAGVLGPFGSKEALQLAVLRRGAELFRESVWDPVESLPAGRGRLIATALRWMDYLGSCPLPGGCLITTAMVEWDARPGAVRDAVVRVQRRWLDALRADAHVAIRAGELPPTLDPDQVAFEINGIAMSLNMSIQLFDEASALTRARDAIERLLAPVA